EFARARPQWGTLAERSERVELTALGPSESEELVRAMLPEDMDAPAGALRTLFERSGGVPGVLVDLVQALASRGAVHRRATGHGHYLDTTLVDALPTVSPRAWLAEQELAVLPPELAAG